MFKCVVCVIMKDRIIFWYRIYIVPKDIFEKSSNANKKKKILKYMKNFYCKPKTSPLPCVHTNYQILINTKEYLKHGISMNSQFCKIHENLFTQ